MENRESRRNYILPCFFILVLAVLLAGCHKKEEPFKGKYNTEKGGTQLRDQEKEDVFEGVVTMIGYENDVIHEFGITYPWKDEEDEDDGDYEADVNYGFSVTENTKLVWEKEILEKCGGTPGSEWDMFSHYLHVSVDAGKEAENPEIKDTEGYLFWKEAKEIRVFGMDEAYFQHIQKKSE